MLRRAERHIPVRRFKVTGIDHARQDIGHALVADLTIWQVLRPVGLGFKKAFHLNLSLKPARGIAFQRFLQDRRARLIADEKVTVTCGALELVANRRVEGPVAVQAACPHAVDGLLAVLLALMLRDAGQQVLDQD
ncbi:MAG: hypothetical protein ROR55_17840 [Devosia sp.]